MKSSIIDIAQGIVDGTILQKYDVVLDSKYPNVKVEKIDGDKVVIVDNKNVSITIGENIEITAKDKTFKASNIIFKNIDDTGDTELILSAEKLVAYLEKAVGNLGVILFPDIRLQYESGNLTFKNIKAGKNS